MRPDYQSILAEGDEAFAKTGNVRTALQCVAMAAKRGEPLPPHVGSWLAAALEDYWLGNKPTMDAALGLAQVRRKMKAQHAMQSAMAGMSLLHLLGATIDQAALLMSRMDPQFKDSTLADRYRRSGNGAKALAQREEAKRRWHITEVRSMLDEYPDTPTEVAQAKAAILAIWPSLAMYGKK